jgi:hypothetical protein
MYQPISFNVIRQALQWHAFPPPRLRVLCVSESDDLIEASYQATWDVAELPDSVRWSDPPKFGVPDVARLLKQVRECFASDVDVLAAIHDPVANVANVLLHVRVSPHIGNWHEHLLNDL